MQFIMRLMQILGIRPEDMLITGTILLLAAVLITLILLFR